MMGRSLEKEEGGEDPGMEKVNEVDPLSKDGGYRLRLRWRKSQL